ncbi:MAG: transposase [Flavipsychrobacter sp.]|nr:transposase [Flavipsychrobacter sp.]
MSTGYQIYDQHGMYYLTFTVVDWVDVFSRKCYRDILIDSLLHCIKNKDLMVYSYVIMTNHMHIICRSATGKLSDTVRDFKKFTSYKIIDAIKHTSESRRNWLLHRFEWAANQNDRNTTYQVWTHENNSIEITTNEFYLSKSNYIHLNPVRAGWVDKIEDYVYSSAHINSLIPITDWQ